MEYRSTLLAVSDMERSKRFYREVLGLEATADYGANVVLTGGISLQTLESWTSLLGTDRVTLPNRAGELYFETEDVGAFWQTLQEKGVALAHPLVEQRWGQRAVRFYDPDGHLLEVGESLETVIRRFAAQGLSPRQTALRMEVPLAMVEEALAECPDA